MTEELSLTLLCVEDDFFTLDELEVALTQAGFEVFAVSTGAEAVAALRSERRFFGLVADVDLGTGPNGWDIAREARQRTPNLPIVYLSGVDIDEWTALGVPHSMMIAKPFAAAQVVTAISSLLNATNGALAAPAP